MMILMCCMVHNFAHASTVQFKINNTDIQQQSCVQLAIEDFKSLLEKNTDTKFVNSSATDVTIEFIKKTNFTNAIAFDSIAKYSGFEWSTQQVNNEVRLLLSASSYKGFANGLYALLQEKIGFKFYHAREMLTPKQKQIEWKSIESFSGYPVFEKMGFHIHSMHPLELTESLLDEKSPNALNNIKEYIDWLAHNGQNYFEFNLLESIDKKNWITHAKQITAYAHSKGIFCGVDLSIHMIQQKAFQLYSGMANKNKKIIKNANWLLAANFDVWNVELSTTEFSQGNQSKKMQQTQLLSSILEQHGVKLMSRSHVVKPDKMVSGNKVASNENVLSSKHGLMVHTVMFYGLTDSVAPVYENKNLLHMRDILLKEKTKREVWYYPESAYWITFDNSVPMLLLPYLSARLNDINYCSEQQVTGHLTFSSGAEWCYWLIDWSIARWSWNYTNGDSIAIKTPLQYVHEISDNKIFTDFVERSFELQEKYIKNKELIRVMTAQTITDEIGGKFNLEFHPRPIYSYKYIRNSASANELAYVQKNYLDKLQTFINESEENKIPSQTYTKIEQEMIDGINITYLRAKHRFNTLSYLLTYRTNKINKTNKPLVAFMDNAESIRKQGIDIVRQRESNYRYNSTFLTQKRKDHTCYHFGYLFPTHDLHFWQREQLQAQKNKYKFMFMNIWSVARIIGIIN